jgi:hypothetical protein
LYTKQAMVVTLRTGATTHPLLSVEVETW